MSGLRTCAIAAAAAGMALAVPAVVHGAVGVKSKALRDAVTLAALEAHLQELQDIATANGDTRASGTPGYDESVKYVTDQLAPYASYFDIQVLPFEFIFFRENSPSELERISPNPKTYTYEDDFGTMQYSGAGNVQAILQEAAGIDLNLTAPTSTSGCDPADFPASTDGRIALVQRGTCTFEQKAANAQAAGAVAVIIFNDGSPGREDNFGGTLGRPFTIPVLSASFAVGEELATTPEPVEVRVETDTTVDTRTTSNVIAETKAGRGDRVVVVGAHLDSVVEGPGINDNGTGSAGILEIAKQMATLGISPRNKVRFMWYGAEEEGLLGSEHYVSTLSKRQIKDIALMLNFDMIGSPNYVRFVYDGDGSDTAQAGPNGSSVIEDVFLKYFAKKDLATKPTAFDGRSDYGPFIAVGIPAGGLFTGAEEIKSAEEAATFGGTAGIAYDPCYHQACDDIDNYNGQVLHQMADAAADAVLQFAMTTSAVKGTSQANDQAVLKVKAEALLYKGDRLQK